VSTPWLPLAGTEQEARQLAAAVVLAPKEPRILHIATHGFFLAEPPPASGGAKAGAAAASSLAGQDPLHRSGLVFVGANRPAADRADDGYLAVAGARSTLLSLWKVDDGHTRSFLGRYYSRLKTSKGRADALLQIQREFRDNKNSNYNDIRVWVAFQPSGDWRALPGW